MSSPRAPQALWLREGKSLLLRFQCSPCRSGDSNQCSLVLRSLYGRAWQMCSFIYLYKGVKHLIYWPRYTHFLQWNPSYVVIKHFCCMMQAIWQLNNKLYCPQWTGTINFTWNLIIITPQAFPCVYTKHKASFFFNVTYIQSQCKANTQEENVQLERKSCPCHGALRRVAWFGSNGAARQSHR